MVDRRQRWHLQDGQRENRPSECDFRGERQGLGRRFQWATRWYLGVSYGPAKDSRRPGIGKKAWGNLPLEFHLRGDSNVWRRISFLSLLSAEKIEIPPDCDACACYNLERFEPGISHL